MLIARDETHSDYWNMAGDSANQMAEQSDLERINHHIGRAKDRESLLQLLAIRALRGEKPEA